MIVYLPYRDLKAFGKESSPITQDLVASAWCIINDSFFTDIPLIFSPTISAIGCILVAASRSSNDLKKWMSEFNIDINSVLKVIQNLVEYYRVLSEYNDDAIKACIGKVEEHFGKT